jgi:hypothetical protein
MIASSIALVVVERFQGDPEDLCNFFWRVMIVSAR